MNGCMSRNAIIKLRFPQQLYLRFQTTGGKSCVYPYSKRDNSGYPDTHISFSFSLQSGLTEVKGC